MAAYIKLGDIEGESTRKPHEKWIVINSMSAPIHRSVGSGEWGANRARGQTTLGDIVCVRPMDKSSVKIAEACASGKFFPEATIDLCSTINDKEEIAMQYKLFDVIVTSHSFHATAEMDPKPSEEITINYSKIEWTYTAYDNQGKSQGKVPGSFDLKTGGTK